MMRLPSSLTTRLALAYGLATAVILASVAAYLSGALSAQLEGRDESELVGEVLLVRHLLREVRSEAEIRADTHRFADIAMGHEGLILVVRSRQGEPLVTLNPRNESVPPLRVLPATTQPEKSMLQTWYPKNGVPSRGIAALGQLGDSDKAVEIVVLRDAGYRVALIRDYRHQVLWATLCGAAVAAGLGFVLARRGLRPLRRMAADAAAVTTSRLATRLDVGSAPAELRELAAALNDMLARLQDSFSRLSEFSADLAHDFRTPISNLIGQTQVTLAQSRGVAEYEALLESNLEEYERLARMIENMLFLARADHAQVALGIRTLDAREELDKMAEYFDAVAADREVALTVTGTAMVQADQTLLRRAVTNLLDNALRHAPAGSTVRLDVERAPAPVSGTACLRVTNAGPAIPPETLPHIFGRFYRADPSRRNSAASTGLGLAIVDTIMRLHGGSVTVRSVEGETMFSLQFPAEALATAAPPAPAPAAVS
ncbi:heavy metal sensor histidine kinase [Cupriavidus necator H16]|uniref:Sensor protein n=1 Tax=Cupriavidus necator (strain ATCC 17699 / DSM 428 / KCTC 22496 / NCIMB 10442 / H16 / Stanier 337) TaxID=381666 RepID=Q0K0P3_CUPNH|nr:heavy metal sensor histidine kinase [Cupriavidus necator]QCC04267.1 heavy metal sensor histidine kinase [Cupriavidus necator H16]QQB78955.1 heavy metal sensor histidine kinase [Cupriavidus necator]WKA43174.1 heavy metal sensor histidine kinase [Cupriavidus necator]CAJ96431.1 signal transduction histidine kinase [Cupriavidus necator H16]